MKKYLATLILLALLGYTFYWSQKDSPISQQVHEQIQIQFKNKLKQYIITHINKNATNLKIKKIWTQTLTKTKVRLDFEYSFQTQKNEAQTELIGYAFLENKDPENSIWNLNKISITEQAIILDEDISINTEIQN